MLRVKEIIFSKELYISWFSRNKWSVLKSYTEADSVGCIFFFFLFRKTCIWEWHNCDKSGVVKEETTVVYEWREVIAWWHNMCSYWSQSWTGKVYVHFPSRSVYAVAPPRVMFSAPVRWVFYLGAYWVLEDFASHGPRASPSFQNHHRQESGRQRVQVGLALLLVWY